MTSKYALAKETLAGMGKCAEQSTLDPVDVQEAMFITLVQTLKETRGRDYVRGLLKYEIDSLGSGGVYEIARGGGHS